VISTISLPKYSPQPATIPVVLMGSFRSGGYNQIDPSTASNGCNIQASAAGLTRAGTVGVGPRRRFLTQTGADAVDRRSRRDRWIATAASSPMASRDD